MSASFVNSALRQPRSARTVLLRMARDQARAERIDQLKQGRPDLTWQAIADYLGVTVRAAQAWRETGAISYVNARKLADLFEVDVLWLLQGAGDGPAATASQLDRIESMLADLLVRVPADASPPAPPDQLLQPASGSQPKRQGTQRRRSGRAEGSRAGSGG